ncbi:MAG: QueT transporter family protein [Deltaproteobacteria bacterium]|nr:QueT transporter family protein [Deltaproteobacteria bacterium]
MKEVFSMWQHTRMVVLTALSAAIFAAVLIPFKGGIPLIPGITEVRPANVFPVVFGLLFGPAGAWGAAIGNTIGDLMGGTLGWGSLAGFVGNFYLGFVPYKMWGATGLVPAADVAPNLNSRRKFVAYLFISFLGAAACGVIIAWFLDLIGLIPFAFLAIAITLNNFLAEILLGPPLLLLLYPQVKKWGLIWTDIMNPEEVSRGFLKFVGALLMVLGTFGGLIIGLGISTGLYGQQLFRFGAGVKGEMGVWLSLLPFLGLILMASFMLSGREQFSGEEG